MRQADYTLVSGGKRPQYIAPIAMRISADLCSEESGEGNDPEVDGPKRQEARVQEEGHGLPLSPRQAMIGERAGEGVVKQKPVSKQKHSSVVVEGGGRVFVYAVFPTGGPNARLPAATPQDFLQTSP
ncbi:unnamed protein product [Boreogadus saida]